MSQLASLGRAEPRVSRNKRGGVSPTATGNFGRLVPQAEQDRLARNANLDQAAREAKGNLPAPAAPAETAAQRYARETREAAANEAANNQAEATGGAGAGARNRAAARAAQAAANPAQAAQTPAPAAQTPAQAATQARYAAQRAELGSDNQYLPLSNPQVQAQFRQYQQEEAERARQGLPPRGRDGLTDRQRAANAVQTAALMQAHAAAARPGRGVFGQNQVVNTNRHTEGIVPLAGANPMAQTLYNGQRTYSNESGLSIDRINQGLTAYFGRPVTFTELGDLVGAPAGSTVNINGANSDSVSLSINHPLFDIQNRTLKKDGSGNRFTYNAHWKVNDNAPNSVGMNVFARQVDASRRMGFANIKVTAAGNAFGSRNSISKYIPGEYVGYNAWARLGYNASIPGGTLTSLPASITMPNGQSPRTLNELMISNGGKDWWIANGTGFSGTFDLTPGSGSMTQLNSFLKDRQTKVGVSYLDN